MNPTPNAPPVLARKTVLFLVGSRTPPPAGVAPVGHSIMAFKQKQTCFVNHHDSTVDLLKFLKQPTDGSVVMLKPGTLIPFALDAYPYEELADGGKVEVVPNSPDQIGPFATPEQQHVAETAARALVPVAIPTEAPASGYPKLLSDPTTVPQRPDFLVRDAEEETKARADGYTVEVPQPVV